MIIVRERPPLFPAILKAFPEASRPGVLFAWGNRIYNPTGAPVTRELHAHEEIHHQQQGDAEPGIIAWWRRYIAEVSFRFEQELPAHVAEYRAWRAGRGGYSRAGFLAMLAERLSGPLYGNVVTRQEASARILEAA